MSRLKLTDTTMDIVVKLSEGNPGAINVCAETLTEGDKIDPQSALGGLGVLLALDEMGIYGSEIWMLYKDVAGENLAKMHALLRARQLGILSEPELKLAILGKTQLDVTDLCEQVKEQLNEFVLDLS